MTMPAHELSEGKHARFHNGLQYEVPDIGVATLDILLELLYFNSFNFLLIILH